MSLTPIYRKGNCGEQRRKAETQTQGTFVGRGPGRARPRVSRLRGLRSLLSL